MVKISKHFYTKIVEDKEQCQKNVMHLFLQLIVLLEK